MADNNAPLDFLNGAVTVEFEFNEKLRVLWDTAKVALGPSMPQAKGYGGVIGGSGADRPKFAARPKRQGSTGRGRAA